MDHFCADNLLRIQISRFVTATVWSAPACLSSLAGRSTATIARIWVCPCKKGLYCSGRWHRVCIHPTYREYAGWPQLRVIRRRFGWEYRALDWLYVVFSRSDRSEFREHYISGTLYIRCLILPIFSAEVPVFSGFSSYRTLNFTYFIILVYTPPASLYVNAVISVVFQ